MDTNICTKDNPWEKGDSIPCQHPDAKLLKDKDYGLGEICACYECPNCDLHFEVELPQ